MTAIEPHTVTTPWDILNRQAVVLAQSRIVPRQYQDHPEDIIAAGLMGAEVGWGVMTSLNLIHVVEGRPEISAEGMVALIRRAGHSLTGTVSPEGAHVHGRRGDNGDEMDYAFTQDDAKRADLAGKQNHRRYPSSMMWARAVSQLARMLFPDVLLGVSYVNGEISGADFDLGEPIIPPAVDVIDAAGHQIAINGPEIYPTDDEVTDLLTLTRSLTDEQRATVKAEGAARARPGKYSWSFLPEHRWTVIELRDATAFIQGLAGAEPWDDAEEIVVPADADPPPEVVAAPEPAAEVDLLGALEQSIHAAREARQHKPAAPEPVTMDDLIAAGRAAGHWDGKTGAGVVRRRLVTYARETTGATYDTPEALVADQDGAERLLAAFQAKAQEGQH